MARVSFCLSLLIVIACLVHSSIQRSTPEDSSYVAAVLEYQVRNNATLNLENYMGYIAEAAEQNADILVFPELTLTSRSVNVPIFAELVDYPVPADRPDLYNEVLVAISQAARDSQIYVLINVQEIMNCSEPDIGEYCPEEKVYLFNTNVVFDRNGAVIDRFRKINLFGEFTRTPALRPDLGIFSTDFGVTFGHFICFDLMFQVPAIQVVEKHNLTDIIFSTMWFSELPYLSAVQIQEAYAYALNVNFIASGANNVNVGSAGSGIYSGKAGALISIMPGVPTTRLLVARVPKVPGLLTETYPGPIYDNPSDHDSLVLITDPSLPSHVSRELVPGSQEFTLVDKDVSCSFRVRLSQRDGEINHHYRAFIQDGSNRYSRRYLGVVACSVVACKGHNAKSCPYRFNSTNNNLEIQELEITMTTYRTQYNTSLKCDNIVYYPSSMRANKFPLSRKNVTYTDTRFEDGEVLNEGNLLQDVEKIQNSREQIVYKLNAPQNDLISFAIWGRIYARDVLNEKPVSEEDIKSYIEIENGIFFAAKRKE